MTSIIPSNLASSSTGESNEFAALITRSVTFLSSVLETNDPEVWLHLLKTLEVAREKGLKKSGVNEKIVYWHNSYDIDKQIVTNTVVIARDPNYSDEYSKKCLVEIESCKSRLLRGLISQELSLDLPESVPRILVEKEEILSQNITQIDVSTLIGQFDMPERREKVYKELVETREEIQKIDPSAKKYLRIRSGDPLSWEEMSELMTKLGGKVAIVSLFVLKKQIVLCVLGNNPKKPQVIEVNLTEDELQYNFIRNYQLEVFNRHDYININRPFTHRWRALGQPLFGPIQPYLVGVEHLIFIPAWPLHLLPLHALTLDQSGHTLLDDFTISYIPALSLLDRLLRRHAIADGEMAIFGYTHADPKTERGARERDIFLGEAIQAARQLGISPTLDAAASGQSLRAQITGRALRLLHLSCHGAFDSADPLRSGVLLADGLFTARDFMNLRFQADLVTLSACQTGISGSMGGDEMAGLSQALLFAGASSLLMGLWSVNAVTTAALMADMYRRLWGTDGQKQMGEAQALREAALALRRGELIPASDHFDPSDPYYWSPFVLIGDWR